MILVLVAILLRFPVFELLKKFLNDQKENYTIDISLIFFPLFCNVRHTRVETLQTTETLRLLFILQSVDFKKRNTKPFSSKPHNILRIPTL